MLMRAQDEASCPGYRGTPTTTYGSILKPMLRLLSDQVHRRGIFMTQALSSKWTAPKPAHFSLLNRAQTGIRYIAELRREV